MSLKTTSDVDPIKSERTGNVREVGSQAIWSLSSCKPGKILFLINLVIFLQSPGQL